MAKRKDPKNGPTPIRGHSRPDLLARTGRFLVAAAVVVPPFVFDPQMSDAFRLPKLLATEVLGLASLLLLSTRLFTFGRVDMRSLWRMPAVRAVVPLVLAATASLLVTGYPDQVRAGLWSLWIAVACLVGWSLAVPDQRRLLNVLAVPGLGLSGLGILQFHGIYRPLDFEGRIEEMRFGITSLAGNAGDLGAYLVLPCLLAQVGWWQSRRQGKGGWGWAMILVVLAYGLAVTQALTAGVALIGASLLLWAILAPRRHLVGALVVIIAVALGVVFAVAPLRARVSAKLELARAGQLNELLTGRLDGWQAAVWMSSEQPVLGVGHGAYAPEYSGAKLALLDRGATFYSRHGPMSTFGNAHNDYLELAAETGAAGVLALAWGLWVLFIACRSAWRARGSDARSQADAALAVSGVVAYALLALGGFPFRIALVGYQGVLFLSWVLRGDAMSAGVVQARSAPSRAKTTTAGEATGASKGWPAAGVGLMLSILLGAALVAELVQGSRQLRSYRTLHTAERVTSQMMASGRLDPRLIRIHLKRLRDVEGLVPRDFGVPLAIGSHYLLLGDGAEAYRWYRRALEIEPRPEVYFNLGRAKKYLGDEAAAQENMDTARRLSPFLDRQVAASRVR